MTMQGLTVSVVNAIRYRRSVREYTGAAISDEQLHELLNAAVQAPTAQHEEPWAFVVVQDKDLLLKISDAIKAEMLNRLLPAMRDSKDPHIMALRAPEFDVFHGAGNLILICAKKEGHFVAADCWLAAENLMLLAQAMDLGTCVIGSAVDTLNGEFSQTLGLPEDFIVYAPIIVGVPTVEQIYSPRKPPRLLQRL